MYLAKIALPSRPSGTSRATSPKKTMKFTLSSLAMVAAPAGAFVVAKPWVSPPMRGGAVPGAVAATEGGNKAGVSEVR